MSLPTISDVLTVGQVTARVAALLRSDELLARVVVRGELSNFRRYSSGHCYFTLKDAVSELRCVLFRADAERLRFTPADGLAVLAAGRIEVYEKRGEYQLYVRRLEQDGRGALHEAYERLRARLAEEGLFDQARKRPLPRYPRRVAVITSPSGAAIQDMLRVLRQRWPGVRIVVEPAVVQGDEAAPSLCAALARVNRATGVDVILFGRGGGSSEDLWAFNEEPVVRAVAASRIPVIAAIGHESDVTLCDLAADLRAATPTHAAELAVPDQVAVDRHLRQLEGRLLAGLRRRLEQGRLRWRDLARRRVLTAPETILGQRAQRLDDAGGRLARAATVRLERSRHRLTELEGRLTALAPTAVLRRGYAIVTRAADRRVVTAPADLPPGEAAVIRVTGGEIAVTAR